MLGNTSFGFSGAGGGTPPPVSNGWLLNGNAEGAEKYFGTNDNFSIPIYTNGSAIGVFLNTGDFGFGTIAPTSRVHIVGVDSTSANFALKVDNSASASLLSVRNDGLFIFNGTTDGATSGNNNFEYKTITGSTRSAYYGATGLETFFDFYTNSVKNTSINEFSGYYAIIPKNRFSIKTFNDSKTHFWMDGIANGFIGIGDNYFVPTAQTHIKGIDSTSSNYALKVDNSASSPLLYVRNDGNIGIGTSSPSYALDVKGTGIIAQFSDLSVTGAIASLSSKLMFGSTSNHDLSFLTVGSERMTISNSGNVGIGTTSASARLHVKGIDATSANYALKVDNSASTPLIYVRNDGNIGIGVASTASKLQVSGATNSGEKLLTLTTTSGNWDILDVGQGTITSAVNNFIFKASGTAGTGANPVITLYDETGGNPSLYMYSALYTSNTLAIDGLGIPRFSAPYAGRMWFNSNVGVGLIATLETRLYVQGSDSTSANYALKVDNSASSPLFYVRNDGVVSLTSNGASEYTSGRTVNTTDATANVTAQTIAVPTDNVISIESTIVYRKTAGAGAGTVGDGTTIKLNGSVKNVSGTLTLDTVQNTYTGTTNAIAGVSATYTISGTNVLISVTGVVNDSITWNVITKVNTVA